LKLIGNETIQNALDSSLYKTLKPSSDIRTLLSLKIRCSNATLWWSEEPL